MKTYPSTDAPVIVINANTLWNIINFREELVKFFISKGYLVYCVGGNDRNFTDSLNRLKNLGAMVICIKQDRKGINPILDLIYFKNLLKIYRNIKPSIVLHFTPKPNIYGSIACRLLGINSFITITGLGSGFLQLNYISFIQLVLYKISLRHLKLVFFQNESDRRLFLQKKIIKNYQASYIPGSGINLEHYKLPLSEINRPLRFIFIGRLIKDKGFHEYIAAARKVLSIRTDAKFFVAGFLDIGNPSAISSSDLEKLAEEGIIEYLGPFSDVREALKLTHVVVLPSYREGLSRLLLEAASCSRPIITTDVPGCRELVLPNISGFLCSVRSIESLYDGIIQMLNLNNDQTIKMGQAGRSHVLKKFSSELVNQTYFNAIKKFALTNQYNLLVPPNKN